MEQSNFLVDLEMGSFCLLIRLILIYVPSKTTKISRPRLNKNEFKDYFFLNFFPWFEIDGMRVAQKHFYVYLHDNT